MRYHLTMESHQPWQPTTSWRSNPEVLSSHHEIITSTQRWWAGQQSSWNSAFITPVNTHLWNVGTASWNLVWWQSYCRCTQNCLCGSSQRVHQKPPKGCVLSLLLFTLYTHDCNPWHWVNVVVKFMEDITTIGRTSNNGETSYQTQQNTTYCSVSAKPRNWLLISG